jgi:adenosylcobyric acid synthase
VVICEGAGSPAEINLLEHDLVNLGLARRAGLPAILVGDIERGGVFAHLYGTVALLPPELASSVKGFVINRFRGDPSLLAGAPAELEARCGVPTLGVLPHLGPLPLDAEDSLALERPFGPSPPGSAGLDVAAIRLPRLSNFTDLDPLAAEPGVHVRWVSHAGALGRPDLVVLGGTRATAADLQWLRDSGLAGALDALRADPSPPVILGICGGLQMMGGSIEDPDGVESSERTTAGLGWLRLHTVFEKDKVTRLVHATVTDTVSIDGYEIRHGCVLPEFGRRRWFEGLERDSALSASNHEGTIVGTTLHGLFENDGFRSWFLADLSARRGLEWQPSGLSFTAARERQIDAIADACEEHLDLDRIWEIAESAGPTPSA